MRRAYDIGNPFDDEEISELIHMQIEKLCDEQRVLEIIKETVKPRIESIQAEVSTDSVESIHQCSLPIASSISAVFESIDDILNLINSDLDALQTYQDSNERCLKTMAESINQVTTAQQQMIERASRINFDVDFHAKFVQSTNQRIRRAESDAVEMKQTIVDEQTGVLTLSNSIDLLNIAIQKARQQIADYESRILDQKEKERKRQEELEAQRILTEITEIEQRKLDESLRKKRKEREYQEKLSEQHKKRADQLRLDRVFRSADKTLNSSRKSCAYKNLFGERSVKRPVVHLCESFANVSQPPPTPAKCIRTEFLEPIKQEQREMAPAILQQYQAWDNTVDSQNWDDSFFND
uniref:Uncharacterized protein n=1 Tax=Ditylenchus dipsaci TaxID=166011 RepID=A0A915EHF1_9BILA